MIMCESSRDARILQYAQINAIHHINKLKNKNHMIISVNTEKVFYKIQQLFMIKNLSTKQIYRESTLILKMIYVKSTANILNGEKMKAFPVRWVTRQGCPPSPLLFNIVLEILATAIWEEEAAKGTQIGKGIKLCLQMTWYYTYKIQRCYQKTTRT